MSYFVIFNVPLSYPSPKKKNAMIQSLGLEDNANCLGEVPIFSRGRSFDEVSDMLSSAADSISGTYSEYDIKIFIDLSIHSDVPVLVKMLTTNGIDTVAFGKKFDKNSLLRVSRSKSRDSSSSRGRSQDRGQDRGQSRGKSRSRTRSQSRGQSKKRNKKVMIDKDEWKELNEAYRTSLQSAIDSEGQIPIPPLNASNKNIVSYIEAVQPGFFDSLPTDVVPSFSEIKKYIKDKPLNPDESSKDGGWNKHFKSSALQRWTRMTLKKKKEKRDEIPEEEDEEQDEMQSETRDEDDDVPPPSKAEKKKSKKSSQERGRSPPPAETKSKTKTKKK
jgi:hypothetical protein